MKNKILYTAVFIILIYSGCSYKSFDVDYVPVSTAYLSNQDTTSIIQYLPSNKMAKIKIKESLNYYWIDAEEVIHTTRGNYSGKLLHGSYEESYPNHNLFVKGQFKYGINEGMWYHYHLNGFLHYKVKWRKGRRIGTVRYYSDDQKLLLSTPYRNGMRHGLECVYQDSAFLINRYKKGILMKSKNRER